MAKRVNNGFHLLVLDEIVKKVFSPCLTKCEMRRFLAMNMTENFIISVIRTHSQYPWRNIPAAIWNWKHKKIFEQRNKCPIEYIFYCFFIHSISNCNIHIKLYRKILQISYNFMR